MDPPPADSSSARRERYGRRRRSCGWLAASWPAALSSCCRKACLCHAAHHLLTPSSYDTFDTPTQVAIASVGRSTSRLARALNGAGPLPALPLPALPLPALPLPSILTPLSLRYPLTPLARHPYPLRSPCPPSTSPPPPFLQVYPVRQELQQLAHHKRPRRFRIDLARLDR